jgi:membrane-associated phospholipid phosphatase
VFVPYDRRRLLVATGIAAALCLLSMALLDGRLALAIASLPAGSTRWIGQVVSAFEISFGIRIWPYLYGVLIAAAGLVTWRTTPLLSRALLFVGLSHVTARFLSDILKPPFSRLRPFQAIENGVWHDTFFAAGGNSFPSGHAIHVWSLFFPLALLFPRYTLPLAIIPLLISAARVAVNDHYLSDVLASAALAAIVTWAYATAVLRDPSDGRAASSSTLHQTGRTGERGDVR